MEDFGIVGEAVDPGTGDWLLGTFGGRSHSVSLSDSLSGIFFRMRNRNTMRIWGSRLRSGIGYVGKNDGLGFARPMHAYRLAKLSPL